MRIRSIKPEFWRSNDVARLDRETRLLFIGLWSYVDDNGVGWDELASIAGDLFAEDLVYGDSRETLAMVSRGLQTLSDAGLIVRYTVDEPRSEHDGRHLLQVTGWEKHQKIDKPSAGHRYPRWSGQTEDLSTPELPVFETLSRGSRETLEPGTGEQGNRGTGDKTYAQVADATVREHAYPQAFEAFWSIYPIRRGKGKALKAWERACKRATIEDINAGARRYAEDPNREDGFTKYAEGWLNADGWLDDPLPDRQTTTRPSQVSVASSWLDGYSQPSGYDEPAHLLEGAAS